MITPTRLSGSAAETRGDLAAGLSFHRAQRHDGFGKGELLADEATHESSAPNLAPRLEAAQLPGDLAPRESARLAPDQVLEHHARYRRRSCRASASASGLWLEPSAEERPAPVRRKAGARRAPGGEPSDRCEPVGRDQACGEKLEERLFDLPLSRFEPPRDLRREGGAAALEISEDELCFRGERYRLGGRFVDQPLEIAPPDDRHRHGPRGLRLFAAFIDGGSAKHELARVREHVEPLGPIVRHPRTKNVVFPTLQLGSRIPGACPTIWLSPSMPRSCVAGAACCQCRQEPGAAPPG